MSAAPSRPIGIGSGAATGGSTGAGGGGGGGGAARLRRGSTDIMCVVQVGKERGFVHGV